MKIIFRDLRGRKRVFRFQSWRSGLDWLDKNFFAVDVGNDLRQIVRRK